MNFNKLIEMVCSTVGIGGSATDAGNQQGGFVYAAGDARVPSVVQTKKKLFGKKKKPLMLRRNQGKLW